MSSSKGVRFGILLLTICLLQSTILETSLVQPAQGADFPITIHGNVFDLAGQPAPVGTAVTIVSPDGTYQAVVLDTEGYYLSAGVMAEAGDVVIVNAIVAGNDLVNQTVVGALAIYRVHIGLRYHGCEALPPEDGQARPESSSILTFRLNNTGNGDDVFDLVVEPTKGWPTHLLIPTRTKILNSSEILEVPVRVHIPSDGIVGQYDNVTVRATSVFASYVQAQATARMWVELDPAMSVTTPQDGYGKPLQVIPIIFNVTNTGNGLDGYDLFLSSSDPSWAPTFRAGVNETGPLPMGASMLVEVEVMVPATGLVGDGAIITLRARSIAAPLEFDKASSNMHVLPLPDALVSAPATVNELPGSVAVLDFEIFNYGNLEDAFMRSVWPEAPCTWSLWPNSGATSTVSINGFYQASVNLQVPPDAQAGDACTVWLNASSETDPMIWHMNSTTVIVRQVPSVGLTHISTVDAVPGSVATVKFEVNNTGNGLDSFSLLPTSNTSWFVTIEGNISSTALLPRHGTQEVTLLVGVPDGELAGNMSLIGLDVVSQSSSTVHDSATDTILVLQKAGVEMAAPAPENRTGGQNVTLIFTLNNTGNGPDNFFMEATSSNSLWPVTILNGSYTEIMLPGSSIEVQVNVMVPIGTTTGNFAIITLSTNSTFDTTVNSSSVTSVGVGVAPGMELVPPSDGTILPGASIEVIFLLRNTGNGPDNFTFTTEILDPTWQVSSGSYTGFILSGSAVIITVTVEAPGGALEDTTVNVILNVTSSFGFYRLAQAMIRVGHMSDVEITCIADGEALPGQWETLSFQITNQGNGPEAFLVEASSNWTLEYSTQTTSILLAGEQATIVFQVQPPAGALVGNYGVVEVVSSGTINTSATVTTQATVGTLQSANLAVTSPSRVYMIFPGQEASASFLVENTGNGEDSFSPSISGTSISGTSISGTSIPGTAIPGGGWLPMLPATVGPLNPGSTQDFDVGVEAPVDAPEGTENIISVSLVSAFNSSIVRGGTALFRVEKVVDLSIFTPPDKSAPPGGIIELGFDVTNLGNGLDAFNLVATIVGNGATVTILTHTSGQMVPGESRMIPVRITLDLGLVAERQVFVNLTASSVFDPAITLWGHGTVNVSSEPKVEVWSPSQREASRGCQKSYSILVMNTGNAPDNYSISIDHTDSNWRLGLENEYTGNVEEFGTATFQVYLTPPFDAQRGRAVGVELILISKLDPEVSHRHFFVVTIPGPDLPPNAQILAPVSGLEHESALELELSGNGTIGGNACDALTYQWSSDLDGILGTGPILNAQLSPGQHQITLLVNDSLGLTDVDYVSVEVLGQGTVDKGLDLMIVVPVLAAIVASILLVLWFGLWRPKEKSDSDKKKNG